jgi:hypothetical protein
MRRAEGYRGDLKAHFAGIFRRAFRPLFGPRSWLWCRTRQHKMPIRRRFDRTGATGLEPATSGVTGVKNAFQRASSSRSKCGRMQHFACSCSLSDAIFHLVSSGRFHEISSPTTDQTHRRSDEGRDRSLPTMGRRTVVRAELPLAQPETTLAAQASRLARSRQRRAAAAEF